MSRWRTGGALLGCCLLVLAACSDDDDDVPDTGLSTSAASVTTVSATGSASTASTTTSTTRGETSIESETSNTVTVDEQVRQAVLAYYDGYWACLRDPDACDPGALTADGSPAREALTATVDDLAASDLHVGPEDTGYIVVEDIQVDPAAGTANVTTCWWSTGVLYGPPAQEGGPETVMNNTPGTVRLNYSLVLSNGAWSVHEANTASETPEVNECPPE